MPMLFTTPPLVITDHPADSVHCCGQTRLGYRYIVLHSTGGTNSLNWLSTTSPDNNPVSCHRLINKAGKNYKIVGDEKTAYTQGPSHIGPLPSQTQNANNWSLSIEFENLNDGHDPYPIAQLDMGAAQVVEWWGAHGLLAIVAHAWIDANKSDPAGFPWDDFYARIWQKLRTVARQ
jgi:N-acetyl-anhydromuramyl-L-alanine amidase AmpD